MHDRPGLQEHAVWREYRDAFEEGNFLRAECIQLSNPDLILTVDKWWYKP